MLSMPIFTFCCIGILFDDFQFFIWDFIRRPNGIGFFQFTARIPLTKAASFAKFHTMVVQPNVGFQGFTSVWHFLVNYSIRLIPLPLANTYVAFDSNENDRFIKLENVEGLSMIISYNEQQNKHSFYVCTFSALLANFWLIRLIPLLLAKCWFCKKVSLWIII